MTLRIEIRNTRMAKQRSSGDRRVNVNDRRSGKSAGVPGAGALSAAAADDLLAIGDLAPRDVERLLADAHRARGYQVVEITASKAAPDACVLLIKAQQRLLLECKYWNTRKIAEMPVRELYGMMAAHDANAGMLVTSGSFTLEATRFAGFGGIQLIDGPRLRALLRQNQDTSPEASDVPAVAANAAAR
jgi:restriction endonuclease Mrr